MVPLWAKMPCFQLAFQPEYPMPVLPRSLEIQGEISAIRRDIHAHPELAYEETGPPTSSPPS